MTKILFYDARTGHLQEVIAALMKSVRAFSVRRDLAKLLDSIGYGHIEKDQAFKVEIKKYSQYETDKGNGQKVLDPSIMPESDRLLFEEDSKRWSEWFVYEMEAPFKVQLLESVANAMDIQPEGFVMLSRYFEIELIADDETEKLRQAVKELEKTVAEFQGKEEKVKKALA